MRVVLHVLIIKDSFWRSIYDLAAVFFGSKEFMYIISMLYIPLISRVFGPYCKLRTEFFSIDL